MKKGLFIGLLVFCLNISLFAISDKTGFEIADYDETTSTRYYGNTYFYKQANYIERHIVSTSSATVAYAASYGDYATNWTNKETLNYFREWRTAWEQTNLN